MAAPTLPHVDPHSDSFHQNPYPQYAALRHEAPVYWVEDEGWCIVSTMELCREVLRNPELFSNTNPEARRSEPPAEVAEEVAAIRAQGFSYVPALNLNDPRSTPATASSSTAPSRRGRSRGWSRSSRT